MIQRTGAAHSLGTNIISSNLTISEQKSYRALVKNPPETCGKLLWVNLYLAPTEIYVWCA